MKTKFLFVTFLILIGGYLMAQDHSVELFDRQQKLQMRAMMVLGTWGLANSISGGIGMLQSDGVLKSFHQMNLGWGVVNTGIAAIGYYGARQLNLDDPVIFSLYNHNVSLSKTLLFNAGLDVGYIGFGLYLRERSNNAVKNKDRLKGFGNSIMVQGAFLFAFDLTTYYFNNTFSKVLKEQLIEFGSTSNGIGLMLHF